MGLGWTLFQGDCVKWMASLEPDSVDSIVCDPPYGLEFMGKEWDRLQGYTTDVDFKGFVLPRQRSRNVKCPACGKWIYDHPPRACTCGGVTRFQQRSMQEWHYAWAVEALRVLKPGGYLLAFGGTRTSHRLACAIEDAGFEIRDSIIWIYGSGFPKSLNVGKAVNKLDGVDLQKQAEVQVYLCTCREQKGLTKGDVDKAVFGGTTRYSWVEGRGGDRSNEVYLPTPEEWVHLKRLLDLDDRFDAYIQQAIPIREHRFRADGGKAKLIGVEEGDWGYQQGGERWDGQRRLTEASTAEAKLWDGWGTALKPAHEPICVARKPLIGTVAQNVLAHGTGALNIDATRITTSENLNGGAYSAGADERHDGAENWRYKRGEQGGLAGVGFKQPPRRWPANVIHDGSDEVLGLFPAKAGATHQVSGAEPSKASRGIVTGKRTRVPGAFHADTGSAARFFYCAKASKAERGEGNTHPTVKPLALMQHLVRLVTPPGGLVVDPFTGSGTTGVAALVEGFRFAGAERDAEYHEIASRRLADSSPGESLTTNEVES